MATNGPGVLRILFEAFNVLLDCSIIGINLLLAFRIRLVEEPSRSDGMTLP